MADAAEDGCLLHFIYNDVNQSLRLEELVFERCGLVANEFLG